MASVTKIFEILDLWYFPLGLLDSWILNSFGIEIPILPPTYNFSLKWLFPHQTAQSLFAIVLPVIGHVL